MNNLSKRLLSEGIGAEKKQARVVTIEEENELWDKGVMGWHSPKPLFNAVFFYCGMLFCLRGGSEHRQLKISQFEVKEVADPSNSDKTIKCITYSEYGPKNHQGLVHQVHLNNKVVTHYADSTIGDRCFVVYLNCMSQSFLALRKIKISFIVSH